MARTLAHPPATASSGGRTRKSLARAFVFSRLAGISRGQLTWVDGSLCSRFGDAGERLRGAVVVRSPRVYRSILLGGATGAGESYARGEWESPDPAAVVEIVAQNEPARSGFSRGADAVRRSVENVRALLHRNTRRGSRRNIAAHYDLGDEFFALFLDPSLTYSCALFEPETCDLEQAQRAKLDRICRAVRLVPGGRVLEIGSGWGSFARHAAELYGAVVDTVTISSRQFDHVRALARSLGLEGRITPVFSDYRDLQGEYDAVVSIEMIEAVGAEYYETFFHACEQRLRPGGRFGLQGILIDDASFESAAHDTDFIKKHIFPGSCIPSLAVIRRAVGRVTHLIEREVFDLTPHYARTLRLWRERLRAHWSEARALGFDEETLRKWEYYFAYCEGGFRAQHIRVAQFFWDRP